MSNVPSDLLYTKDHEWVRPTGADTAVVGITDYAQSSLGDVTFVELPTVGSTFKAHQTFGVVESVKAASDLYMPLACTVTERNEDLINAPESVNKDPYGSAWMLKVKIANPADVATLLKADAYAKLV